MDHALCSEVIHFRWAAHPCWTCGLAGEYPGHGARCPGFCQHRAIASEDSTKQPVRRAIRITAARRESRPSRTIKPGGWRRLTEWKPDRPCDAVRPRSFAGLHLLCQSGIDAVKPGSRHVPACKAYLNRYVSRFEQTLPTADRLPRRFHLRREFSVTSDRPQNRHLMLLLRRISVAANGQ